MNTLKYKGYVGSVAYSEADQVFFGKIEGIDGLVNYEGQSVGELTNAFKEAVDDYLVFCEEKGLKPEKSYTGTFNVRISPETHRGIARLAAQAGVSINAFVKQTLSEVVSHRPLGNGMADTDISSSILSEPDASYGRKKQLTIKVPPEDIPLAQEIVRRMGWKL